MKFIVHLFCWKRFSKLVNPLQVFFTDDITMELLFVNHEGFYFMTLHSFYKRYTQCYTVLAK